MLPIGVVTAIAAPASLRITIEGQGGHAGAVLMPRPARCVSGCGGNCACDRSGGALDGSCGQRGHDGRVRYFSARD